MPAARATSMQEIVDQAVAAAVKQFAKCKLSADEIAISLIDIRNPDHIESAGHRESEAIYPASIIKLFYAVAAYHWMKQGKIGPTPEFDRAMRAMIVDSSNDASSYLIDLLTGTTSGLELQSDEMAEWTKKRNSINDFFRSLGYRQLNATQKPWSDGPYGRERVFLGEKQENRNLVSTKETARLLTEIVLRRAAAPIYCAELLKYMHRDRSQPRKDTEDQAHDFIGGALPAEAEFWSKAGWTSAVRHDAIYIELPGGGRFILVVFTTNHSKEQEILPNIGSRIVSKLGSLVGTHA